MNVILSVVVITGIMFPLDVLAEESSVSEKACERAMWDARNDVNRNMWASAGFFFSVLGVAAANIFVAQPPSDRFAGKSEEYVENYMKCYKKAMSDQQNNSALRGCLISASILSVAFILFYAYIPIMRLFIEGF